MTWGTRIMEDVISVSSGSDDDSDVVVVSSYQEVKENAVPFIREEWLPVTPVLIDITNQKLALSRQKGSKKDTISPIFIDLSDFDDADVQLQNPQALPSIDSIGKHVEYPVYPIPTSFEKGRQTKSQTNDEKDVAGLECRVGSGVQSVPSVLLGQKNSLKEPIKERTEDLLHQGTNCNSTLPSEHLSWDNKSVEHCRSNDISSPKPFESLSEVLKNFVADVSRTTKDTQLRFSTPASCSDRADQENEENIDSSIWDGGSHALYSLDSPYYCPGEVDAVIFYEESIEQNRFTTWNPQQSAQHSKLDIHTELVPEKNLGKNKDMHKTLVTHIQPSSPTLPSSLGVSPSCSPELAARQNQLGKPNSPTSTEILASDTVAHSPGLSMESISSNPFSFPTSLPSSPTSSDGAELRRNDLDAVSPESSSSRFWQSSISGGQEDIPDDVESDLSEYNTQDRQYICLTQFRKLRRCMGGTVPCMHEDREEDEDFGSPEPLCRQSLSLVYSTIEENYPEGTLQLLADFIHPRYYPPVDITTHLLRGIFLDPQSPDVLAIEAYNLLMKIQRYHPADTSTIPWDWELLMSVMEKQDDTKRLRTEIRCMLLQYVSQVLEDDFQFKLTSQPLHHSIAKAMLSCDQKFRHVKDIINWMMTAVKESITRSDNVKDSKKESNNCLKIVLSLQRILTLALEVDRTPTFNSSKLSQKLFQSISILSPCRRIRLLLLSTVESSLLRCKLLDLILNDACSQRSPLTMSLSLLLHYLQNSTLPSDPSDKEERWRKWEELLQLLWMLLLSYEEVVTGHLHCPITERFERMHSPAWTRNDQVTRLVVREAAEVFLSRAVKDIGHDLPKEIQESLSQLQDHITDMSSVI